MASLDILLYTQISALVSHYQRRFLLPQQQQIQRPIPRHYTQREAWKHTALNAMSLSKPSPQNQGNSYRRGGRKSVRTRGNGGQGPLNQLSKDLMDSERLKQQEQRLYGPIALSLVFLGDSQMQEWVVSDFCACSWTLFPILSCLVQPQCDFF